MSTMSAGQIQFNLGFSADTSQAKVALSDLQNQLTQIVSAPTSLGAKMTEDIQAASAAAAELKIHLDKATNVNTGALDFGKLNQSLKQSGMSLTEYASKLQKIGPAGQQAFMMLANSVSASEIPLKRANGALEGMAQALKNTAKWQISSSVLHGFMGAVQKAYGYAQDLNKSLNNIRIVSGQTTDQMAKFAERANSAAKALSTTTTEYTNASLIYYQQGLSDSEVEERTNATIKMANASGQSAEIVADQLTAIWNNFDDGSKSLEYYADVLTALGAATASSTDEIAGGLEKFAAIGETIGLSYEYAASALATITSNTRQSEEVVGTALKTIFARIQGLNLGDTLEDGTTLNKYSEALEKIGVSIYDSSGGLKKMDNILAEMAEKWKDLSSDQQVALAQTVAGVRQYNQLVSLMDNWYKDDSDSMVSNLSTAYGSAGTLDEQAKIYAESWEAARDRVQASLESVYSNLISDEFFIKLTNGIGSLVDGLGQFIEGMGGLGGVISGIGVLFTKVFAEKMAQGFRDLVYNVQMSSKVGVKMIQDQKAAQVRAMADLMATSDASTATEIQTKKVYEQELSLQSELIENASRLSEQEQKKYGILLQQHKALGQNSIELTKQHELIKEQAADISTDLIGQGMMNTGQDYSSISSMMRGISSAATQKVNFDGFADLTNEMGKLEYTETTIDKIINKLELLGTSDEDIKKITNKFKELSDQGRLTGDKLTEFKSLLSSMSENALQGLVDNLVEMGASADDIQQINDAFAEMQGGGENAAKSLEKVQSIMAKLSSQQIKKTLTDGLGLAEGTPEYEAAAAKLREYYAISQKSTILDGQRKQTNKNLQESYASLGEAIRNAAGEQVKDWANHLTAMTSSLMSAGMLVSSINSMINMLEDPDSSGWEKFGAILTNVSMIATSVTGVFKGFGATMSLLKSLKDKDTIATIANTAAGFLQEKQSEKWWKTKKKETAAIKENSAATKEETVDKIANAAVDAADGQGGGTPIEFKGKYGQTRTYSGKKNLKGQLLDDNGDLIAEKYQKKHNLNDFGKNAPKTDAPKVDVPNADAPKGGKIDPKALASLGSAAASAAVLIAALAVAAVMLAKGFEAMNTAEDRLKNTTAAAQDLSAAAEKTRSEMNEFQSTMDQLATKKDALKGLTEGTLEYKKALLESNAEVIKLIASNDKLSMEDLEVDAVTGAYGISEDAQKRVLEEQMAKATMQQSIAVRAEANKADAQQGLEVDSFLEKQHKDEMWANIAVGGATGAAIGGVLGSFLPGIGNAVGAAAGAIAGAGIAIGGALMATGKAIDKEAAAFDAINFEEITDPAEKLRKGAEALGLDFDSLDNSMKEEIAALIANKEATDANTAALLRETTKQGFAEEFEGLSESEKNLASDSISKEVNATADAVKKQLDKRWEGKLNGSEKEEAAAMLGYGEGTKIVEVKGDDGIVRYNAVDAAGNTLEELGTLEAITTRVSQEYANKAAKGEDMTMYTGEIGQKVLGTNQVQTFDADYELGTNQGELAANKYNYDLEGEAEALFDKAVAEGKITAAKLDGDKSGNIVKGIQAVADATGNIDKAYYEENKDAIGAYYQAMFGETISTDNLDAALNKLNEVKSAGAETAKETDETKAQSIAQQAVTDGLIESTEAFDAYIDSMLTAEQKSKLTKEEQAKMGKQLLQNQSSLKKAASGMQKYNDALKSNDAIAKSNAIGEIAQGLNEVFGEGAFDSTSVEKHMDKIQKALNGDKQALEELQDIAAEDYLIDVGVNIKEGVGQEINDWIGSQEFNDLEIGATLDDTGMTESFQRLLASGDMTVEEMNKLFEEKLGFTPEITYQEVKVSTSEVSGDNSKTQVSYTDPVTGEVVSKTVDTSSVYTTDSGTVMKIPVINGSKTVKTIDTGSSLNNFDNGLTSKGGSSEPKKAQSIDRDGSMKRYKELEDSLDDIRDASEKASKAADRLYGAGRIVQMAKANAQIQKEIKLLKQKKELAKEYLKLDKLKAEDAAKEVGVTLQYDENGNITNYTEELDKLITAHEEKVKTANEKPGGASEEEIKKLDEEREKIEALTAAMEKYDETREQIDDFDTEAQDKFYEWQDNNFEMWSHSLEVTIDISDDAMEILDSLLKRTEGHFFAQAESIAIMGSQLALTNVQMGIYVGHLGLLGGLMAADKISTQSFIEGLEQIQQGAMSAAEAIYEFDEKMIHLYGDALSMAREEIDIITDHMEHGTSVLEHYLSLLDLMGQSNDYKSRGIILEGQVQTIKNEFKALEEESQYMAEEAKKKKALYDSAILPTTAEVYKQQYEDALQASMETQDEFLAKAEEYAAALNDILENSLNQFSSDLENALTGGKGFDQLTTEMERMVSLQEEYLTTTNKVYETEKLMNQAQQEIDKTTNTVAKQKLKQFIAETNQLKEKNQLSKFELDVQKAKYDLLVAQIALEEAQKAKSQVRLKRDSEGNFGYVYTADSAEIDKAQQTLADKQNVFYNIALEGVNTYAEKYAQTLREMYDSLIEIDQQYKDGQFASEAEYHEVRLAAQSYYFNKLRQYSEIYNIAIQLDSNATAESWGKDYQNMINSTEDWEIAVSAHAENVTKAFNQWGDEMTWLADRTDTSMDSLANSVSSVTKESDELLKELVKDGGLLDQIKMEMSLVSTLTGLYASLRAAVLALAAAYTALAFALTMVKAVTATAALVEAFADSDAAEGIFDAIGDAASDSNKKTSSTSTEKASSEKSDGTSAKTIDLKAGHAIYDYVGAPQESLKYGGTYDVLGESGDYLIIGKGSSETGKIKKPEGWASGGYTGEWGSYGKLAMLHEKELILNAKDTENFLASMELLDDIVSTIDLHAASQSLGRNLNSPDLRNVESGTLEQSVKIEANFPNVSSRVEIEEAFSTLINRASQYANRK